MALYVSSSEHEYRALGVPLARYSAETTKLVQLMRQPLSRSSCVQIADLVSALGVTLISALDIDPVSMQIISSYCMCACFPCQVVHQALERYGHRDFSLVIEERADIFLFHVANGVITKSTSFDNTRSEIRTLLKTIAHSVTRYVVVEGRAPAVRKYLQEHIEALNEKQILDLTADWAMASQVATECDRVKILLSGQPVDARQFIVLAGADVRIQKGAFSAVINCQPGDMIMQSGCTYFNHTRKAPLEYIDTYDSSSVLNLHTHQFSMPFAFQDEQLHAFIHRALDMFVLVQGIPLDLADSLRRSSSCIVEDMIVFESCQTYSDGVFTLYGIYDNSLVGVDCVATVEGSLFQFLRDFRIQNMEGLPFPHVHKAVAYGGFTLFARQATVETLQEYSCHSERALVLHDLVQKLALLRQYGVTFANLSARNVLVTPSGSMLFNQFALEPVPEDVTVRQLGKIAQVMLEFHPRGFSRHEILPHATYLQKQFLMQADLPSIRLEDLLANPLFMSDDQKAQLMEQYQRSKAGSCRYFERLTVELGIDPVGIVCGLKEFTQTGRNGAHGMAGGGVDNAMRFVRNQLAHFSGRHEYTFRRKPVQFSAPGELLRFLETRVGGIFQVVYDCYLLERYGMELFRRHSEGKQSDLGKPLRSGNEGNRLV
uniref:Uncharacterized protein n=1 Tax=Spironucleus salmonicida TaxID=348837 RepID=V6LLR2_9EUKA|eukprot:EST45542.1 Hypothetical protein SS50377_14508 [Spironucleus salmonicida]